eukprot:GHVH01004746.1.p1 GENE.GHVH01004746.1~~GHVH01004746.1.p1  ORF type:complete len:609 (+),score=88.40 GHVH01004746.1:72-1898(+)
MISLVASIEQYGHEILFVLICIFLVILAAIASGLTVGLLSMEPLDLKMLRLEGNFEEKYKANEVLKLISNKHLIMVTLLLTNSIAMEALPVFLDKLVPSWVAVTLSVTAILIFGEILPQAFCTGPQQLDIAYRSAPLMNCLICITYPISKPVSVILDSAFGQETERNMNRSSLKTLVALHRKAPALTQPLICGHDNGQVHEMHSVFKKSLIVGEDGQVNDPWAADDDSDNAGTSLESDGLLDDEVVVIQGALDLASKRVCDVMTPTKRMFMLEATASMTKDVRHTIVQNGFSRVPVYEGDTNNVVGIILVKSLVDVDWTTDSEAPTVASCMVANRKPIFVGENVSLWSMLNEFQKGRTHIAYVVENPNAYIDNVSISDEIDEWDSDSGYSQKTEMKKELLGCLTIEDIFEELIQEEIYDEFDFKKKPMTFTEQQASRSGLPLTPSSAVQKSISTGFTGSARSRIVPRLNSIICETPKEVTEPSIADVESGVVLKSNTAHTTTYVTANDIYNAQNILQSVLTTLQPIVQQATTHSAPMSSGDSYFGDSPPEKSALARMASTRHGAVISRNQKNIMQMKSMAKTRSTVVPVENAVAKKTSCEMNESETAA